MLTRSTLPLFDAYPALRERVAWIPIGDWPTPILRAKSFGNRMSLPRFYIKREDLSHAECGGNKTRGLEFLLADAQRRGLRTILTFSSVGSHHLCRTAWHAQRLGIRTVAIVLDQPNAQYVRTHLAWAMKSGARYVPANFLTALPKGLYEWFRRENRIDGRLPYLIPPGGTSPRACLGHVSAAMELAEQIKTGLMPEPDYIFLPMGSLGTAAGLTLGCKLAGLRSRVVGVAVSYCWYCTPRRTARLARRTLAFMRRLDPSVPKVKIEANDVQVVTTALGDGYACFTPESVALAQTLREDEGLMLDGTYSGKALDGALQLIRGAGLSDRIHLFWHTYQRLRCTLPVSAAESALPTGLRKYFESPAQPLDEWFDRSARVDDERNREGV